MRPTRPKGAVQLYNHLRKRETLERAWRHVYQKAKKSTASQTRKEADEFAIGFLRNLERIEEQLRKGQFVFAPAKGIVIRKRNGKKGRPVVIAPIESRIVQRALLDVIQGIHAIKDVLTAGHNFGGVEGSEFGVPAAVIRARAEASASHYYIRTDIKSFFTQVPRDLALAKITAHINDARFNEFLTTATTLELTDVAKLGNDVGLFPLHEDGVAQGSCLSPLLCNMLLADFDTQMNRRGIACIRYIDDFILFAKSRAAAFKALESGTRLLADLGLEVYDPRSAPDKAAHGVVRAGFSFLGCDVRGERIRPSKRNRERLKSKIADIFHSTLGQVKDPTRAALTRSTYAEAVRLAADTIRGWGNTHAFCNDLALMKTMDVELGRHFDNFNTAMKKRVMGFSEADRRRALGFFLLADCNRNER